MTLAYRGYTAAQLHAMPRLRIADADHGHHADNPKYKPTTLTAWPGLILRSVADDPAFPSPTDWQSTRDLMGRFTHEARVLFAVTAAEMALAHWEKWINAQKETPRHNGKEIDREAPQKAIAACWEWLDAVQSGDKKRIKKAEAAAANAADDASVAATAATTAATATTTAAFAGAAAADAAAYAAADADAAAYAAAYAYAAADAYAEKRAEIRRITYAEWWARCRCRLAVAMPECVEFGREDGGEE